MTDTTTAAHARPNWQAVRTYEDIRFERDGGLAKITICRPEVRNAFRPKTLHSRPESNLWASRPLSTNGWRSRCLPRCASVALASLQSSDVSASATVREAWPTACAASVPVRSRPCSMFYRASLFRCCWSWARSIGSSSRSRTTSPAGCPMRRSARLAMQATRRISNSPRLSFAPSGIFCAGPLRRRHSFTRVRFRRPRHD